MDIKEIEKRIPKGWNEVSLRVYDEIVRILEDRGENDNELETTVRLIAVMADISEDEVYDLPIGDLIHLQNSLRFMDDFGFDTKLKMKYININGNRYKVCVDINKYSVAQYVDFQLSYARDRKNIRNMLSVILVPDGKKYGDYDMEDVFRDIDELDIVTANSICFFLRRKFASSIKAMLIFSEAMMKVMKLTGRKRNKEAMEKIQMQIKEMRRLFGYVA